jgi:hypothetical protein
MQFHGTFTTDTERAAILARAIDLGHVSQSAVIIGAAIALAAIVATYATTRF